MKTPQAQKSAPVRPSYVPEQLPTSDAQAQQATLAALAAAIEEGRRQLDALLKGAPKRSRHWTH